MNKNLVVFAMLLLSVQVGAQVSLDPKFYHLRNNEPREWSDFPEKAFGKELTITFRHSAVDQMYSLGLRQHDVKLTWIVSLNGHRLGTLLQDEADLLSYFNIEKSILTEGNNTIRIFTEDKVADDIHVGEVKLFQQEVSELLEESTLSLKVVDEKGNRIPGQFTVINNQRLLQPVFTSTEYMAARPGHIYTPTGEAFLQLPAGVYTLFAGRGFEYSVDSTTLEIEKGESRSHTFTIKHEVDTKGWISCDPHIHTFTHSRHGDATDKDRVITLAGEGIELPIITDHNQHVDLSGVTKGAGVEKYFTLVTGNEVTTKVGHFNLFPVQSTDSIADNKAMRWADLSSTINQYPNRKKVIVLNHARDIHHGFRPHDPSRFLSVAGQRLDGEPLFANAMEVMNSGSQQSDWKQLFQDWMHLLNAGHNITPVGSSDSHDVSRFIVGQGRTYIRGNDSMASSIHVDEAVENFLAGKVMVSCGLLTSIKVNENFGPGEMASGADHVSADIEVSGPSWTRADKIVLYINGKKFKEEKITDKNSPGVKWRAAWQLPKSRRDYHVVAIAEGPGDKMIFWPLAKPYQPSSPDWTPRVIGASGAVWVDADGNGKRESTNDYARKIISKASNDVTEIIKALQGYDEAVAIQVAAILHLNKVDLTSKKIQAAIEKGDAKTRAGFEKVMAEIKMSNPDSYRDQ